MLRRILLANDGLPPDTEIVFANTGKEEHETLDFVKECGERWGVPIVWVEYKRGVVTHETASRHGEPYEQLIEDRGLFLPNPTMRFCTQALKLEPRDAYLRSLGWTEWDGFKGIRADEPHRIPKLKVQRSETPEETKVAPLVEAGIGIGEVFKFWKANDFDLRLPNHRGKNPLGNCDLCFLKGVDHIVSLIRDKPSRAVWWMKQEQKTGGTFRADRPSYTQMHKFATSQQEINFGDEALQDCECTDVS